MQISYYSLIGGLAIIIHLILNYDAVRMLGRNSDKASKSYRLYLSAVFAYYVADCLWGVLCHFNTITLLYIDTIFYYITMAITVLCWCRYVYEYLALENVVGRALLIVGKIFCISEIGILFINHFYHIFFGIDENGVYREYIVRNIALAIQVVLFAVMAFASAYEISKSEGKGRRRYMTIFAHGMAMVITVMVQIFNPFLPVYSIGLMIGTCVLHVFILEDEKEEFRQKLLEREKELKENAEIFDNAGYGLWKIRINENGRNEMVVNETLQKILGVEKMDLTPEQLYTFYHERLYEDIEEIESDDYRGMLEGKIKQRSLCWDHPTKGIIYLRAGGTSHVLENGEVVISGYCGDDTEHYESEQMLRERLNEAKLSAEEASRAKSTFLFNMSHDIRTPMNAIIGFTDLLEKYHDDPDKVKDYLAKIRNSSQFLLSLINNVLEMARIESGKSVLDEASCDIVVFENALRTVFQEQMDTKGLTFKIDVDVEHRNVYCDEVKLREIFLNLVSNAYKYTLPGGSVTMTIKEMSCRKKGYAKYKVIIADTGIGMTPEFLPRLFEEFSREKTFTDNKIEGTGLGMPIVKRYLELMGGRISVKSKIGKGTTFEIVIVQKIANESEKVSEEKTNIDRDIIKGKRILLAEDNDLNAEIAMETLSDVGLLVERAEDGIVCIDMINKNEPGYYDVILMDVQMPNIDGIKATEIIRHMTDKKKSMIPIVAMTANAFDEDKKKVIDAGMNGHLAKPVNIDEVINMLANILCKK